MNKLILAMAFGSVMILTSCAAMQQQMAEAQAQEDQNFQTRYCNYDGAFENGVNAASAGQPMSGSTAMQRCSPETRADSMKGYRAGYMSVASRPSQQPVTVVDPNVGSGYAPGRPYPPTYPSTYPAPRARQCRDAYGQHVCGYGCDEAYGQVRCARLPNHDCMHA